MCKIESSQPEYIKKNEAPTTNELKCVMPAGCFIFIAAHSLSRWRRGVTEVQNKRWILFLEICFDRSERLSCTAHATGRLSE